MTNNFKIKKAHYDCGEAIDNCYEYRGIEFERVTGVPHGYFNAYECQGRSFSNRKEVLAYIDSLKGQGE